MQFKPRNYQRTMIDFMVDTPRANVWADMGLGKSVATLTALDLLWLVGSNLHPALVLGPLRVARDVWAPEGQKWDHLQHLRISPIVGSPAQRKKAMKTPADIYTINYDNVLWLMEQLGDSEWPFKIVIADESTRLKNFRLRKGGKRAAALAKISSKTGRWINLTGTPAPNGLIDLWGQTWFLDHGERLGRTFTAFKQRWFDENVYRHTIKPKPNANREITEALSDITLSLKATDYLELPPLIENTVHVELPVTARNLYAQLENELFMQIEGREVEALTAAHLSMKCLQLASGAVYYEKGSTEYSEVHGAKLDALESIVNEQSGAPIIVVYHWQSDKHRIIKRLSSKGRSRRKVRELNTSKDEIDWNKGRVPVLLVHADSAGHGLNLQNGGNALVFFSNWWNAESREQVIERIGPTRQLQAGHDRPTIVHNIVARDTVDETVMERHKTKRSVQDLLRERVNRKRGS